MDTTKYIEEFRVNGNGFEQFSDDAIVYAILEYSRYPRPFSKEERIVYFYDKCCEYEQKPQHTVSVEFDEQYGFFTVLVTLYYTDTNHKG